MERQKPKPKIKTTERRLDKKKKLRWFIFLERHEPGLFPGIDDPFNLGPADWAI